jgi:small ligand-binding sensory domain FIST
MPISTTHSIRAGSGLGIGEDWRHALSTALDHALGPLDGEAPDLVVVFASAAYENAYGALIRDAVELSQATELAGCSASAVIAGDRELEDQPGVALLAVRLPPAALLSVRHVAANDLNSLQMAGLPTAGCHGAIVLADPFTVDVGALVAILEGRYPHVPIVGGLATADPTTRSTSVFCGSQLHDEGAVVISVGGSIRLQPVVSQGCEPIGQSWTITDTREHIIRSIGGRPAYEVLVDTLQHLEPAERERASRNLLVGLAMDEYQDEFKRGDFLIRNLMGVDPRSGAIAVAAEPRVGQTLQFQIRDARAADEELRAMLTSTQENPSAAALLFACNGRGAGLFGAPDHDARTVREVLGPLPLAGLFCNGEIGPVGTTTFLHGFTASLALLSATATVT